MNRSFNYYSARRILPVASALTWTALTCNFIHFFNIDIKNKGSWDKRDLSEKPLPSTFELENFIIMKMEAAGISETSVLVHQTTCHHFNKCFMIRSFGAGTVRPFDSAFRPNVNVVCVCVCSGLFFPDSCSTLCSWRSSSSGESTGFLFHFKVVSFLERCGFSVSIPMTSYCMRSDVAFP